MKNHMARKAGFGKLWSKMAEDYSAPARASFSIEASWAEAEHAWIISGIQDEFPGGASMEVVLLGADTLLLRLPGDYECKACPWVVASYRVLEWKATEYGAMVCTTKDPDGIDVSFRVYVFAGSRQLEIVEHEPRDRKRLLKVFRGIQFVVR